MHLRFPKERSIFPTHKRFGEEGEEDVRIQKEIRTDTAT